MKEDPLNTLVKSHDFVQGVELSRHKHKEKTRAKGYYIQYLGKIIKATRFPYSKLIGASSMPFPTFESAEKWAFMNYKGSHRNWRVVKI